MRRPRDLPGRRRLPGLKTTDSARPARQPSCSPFDNERDRIVFVRRPRADTIPALHIAGTHTAADTTIARYTHRWFVETAIGAAKQVPRHWPGPQPAAARRPTHRDTPTAERTAAPPQTRHRIQRHAHPAPQALPLRELRNLARLSPTPTNRRRILRLPTSLCRSRHTSTKLKMFETCLLSVHQALSDKQSAKAVSQSPHRMLNLPSFSSGEASPGQDSAVSNTVNRFTNTTKRPGHYIRSGAAMPSKSSPCASVAAVSSHKASRLARTTPVSALSTGQPS
jgi:hypothetical protein